MSRLRVTFVLPTVGMKAGVCVLGLDRLQRGERVVAQTGPEPQQQEKALDAHSRWAWWALGDGYKQTARKYAWRNLRSRPLTFESWKLVYCATRGR